MRMRQRELSSHNGAAPISATLLAKLPNDNRATPAAIDPSTKNIAPTTSRANFPRAPAVPVDFAKTKRIGVTAARTIDAMIPGK